MIENEDGENRSLAETRAAKIESMVNRLVADSQKRETERLAHIQREFAKIQLIFNDGPKLTASGSNPERRSPWDR